jgi:pimeloyl-ACP methyl ester carboxylesterase
VREFRDTVVATLSDPVPPALAREFQLSTLAHPVAPAFLDTVVGETLKVPARVWKAVFDAFIEDDFSAALADITAPTLIVWGDQDAFGSRDDQETMAVTMAGSRLVVYEGAGHALHWEQPERFARELVAWMAQAVGRPGAIIAR